MNVADKRIEWKERFDAWKTSGLSAAEWCRKQNIKVHQMYYWIRKFKEESNQKQGSETKWLSVNMQNQAFDHSANESVLIHLGEMSIEVRPGTDMELLFHVVRVIQDPYVNEF